ncbi:hypothetical protein GQ53DRAFT_777939 [Thozetella sp. PMI_491]|nr:hypothetical protein GQ53DRAFT_777939 [Thozetella sp. PMI_491]
MGDTEYRQTSRNKIHRLRNRGHYDFKTVHEIINGATVLHVSFVPDPSDPFPIVLPMIGQLGLFSDDRAATFDLGQPLDLYLHGSISSHLMRLCQEALERGEVGLPLCIAATRVDGLVLALTPFHHSYNFRSAVLHGHGQVVQDLSEKMYALELITNKVVPERWQNTRTPPNKVELESTHILRVQVFSGSAKVRLGGPNGDRGDLKNPDVLQKYWSGVVPMWEMLGDPLPAPQTQLSVPRHVSSFIEKRNLANRVEAQEAAKELKA